MKHMSHPNNPDFVIEAPDDRARMLAKSGWTHVKPGPAPKDEKPEAPKGVRPTE